MWHQLTWSHYIELLPLNDFNKMIYYIQVSIDRKLSKRSLRLAIKNNEYERLDDKTIGIIIAKRDNKFVMEYCSDLRIFRTTYELI